MYRCSPRSIATEALGSLLPLSLIVRRNGRAFSKSLRPASAPHFPTPRRADLLLQNRPAHGLPLRLATAHLSAVCTYIAPCYPRSHGEVPSPTTNTIRASTTPVRITRIIAHSPCPAVVTHIPRPVYKPAKPHRSSAFTTIRPPPFPHI